MDKKNPAEPGVVVSLSTLDNNNTTSLRPQKTCICCGISFSPKHAYYRLCSQCHNYSKVGNGLQMAARLLKGVRHG